MGKSIAWLAPASVISVAALTALALDRDVSVIPHARAQDLNVTDQEALCPRGDATLLGTYMAIGGGTVVGFGPVAFVGKLTYHGDGWTHHQSVYSELCRRNLHVGGYANLHRTQ
jgi:hypothetical protein